MLLLAQLVDKDLDTMKIKNGDLMTFHAVALSLREFCDVRTHLCLAKRSPLGSRCCVQALLEADKLVWGGDAGWLNAQFQ